tara:strand:- start:49 stop:306 length:258 start_codon:yes stop_codon:yes gene_type:complete
MQQVWKYEVPPNESAIEMPIFAEILSAQFQGDKVYVWALVDIDKALTQRKIFVRGTGHNIRSENLLFIQTIFYGAMVFHVFEDRE